MMSFWCSIRFETVSLSECEICNAYCKLYNIRKKQAEREGGGIFHGNY